MRKIRIVALWISITIKYRGGRHDFIGQKLVCTAVVRCLEDCTGASDRVSYFEIIHIFAGISYDIGVSLYRSQ